MTDFFKDIAPVKFEGPNSANPLAYRHYNKDEMVLDKRMEDHIRPAIAYWHSFAWEGGDPFGGRSFDRPWFGKGMEGAKLKADVTGAVSTRVSAQSILLRTLGEYAPRTPTAIVAGAIRRPAALPIAVHSSGLKTVLKRWGSLKSKTRRLSG